MRRATRKMNRQTGVTLIETMIAVVVLVIGVLTTMSLFTVAILQNWNQGDRATRVTEYGQDKMEQLLALPFNDNSVGGLGTAMAASSTVGGVTPGSPVANYTDYIDNTGAVNATNTNALYIRQWSVATGSGTSGQNLKTITVRVGALTIFSGTGGSPATTLVAMKSN